MITSRSRIAVAAGVALSCAGLLCSCAPKTAQNPSAPGAPPVPEAALQPPPAPAAPSADVQAKFAKPRKATGPLKFQIVSNAKSPFWDPVKIGMDRQAAAEGATASMAAPDRLEVPLQRRLLEAALAKGVDGIAVSAIDAQALKPIINEIMDKGAPPIPIICVDSDSPESNRLAYIGTNNFAAGQAAGNAAVKLLPKGGDVVAFVGTKGTENAAERINGFRSAAEPKGIKVIAVMEDQGDKTKARKNVEDVINKYGDKLAGFLGVYSYNGPAIAAAVQSAKKRANYKIMSFDLEPATIDALKTKDVDFTIVQNPYDFGRLAVQFLTLVNRKGLPAARAEMKMPENGVVDTGVNVVTPDNIAQFLQGMQKKGITSS
ncbi:MAG TPA: substrate-binding domain-containing protein [Armatimonadota bacterium]|jgi:ribose transport system substrate-binding protein